MRISHKIVRNAGIATILIIVVSISLIPALLLDEISGTLFLLGLSGVLSIALITLLIILWEIKGRKIADNQLGADLQKANKHFKNVMEASSKVAIMAIDINGTFTLFNSGAENIFGYRSEELIGKTTPEIMFDEDGLQYFGASLENVTGQHVERGELFSSHIAVDISKEIEIVTKRKDGKRIDVSLNLSPIKDDNNQTTGILGVAFDISSKKTAEKALSESEKKYRMLADNVTDVIWIRDINTLQIKYLSPACEKMYGYTQKELTNKSLEETLPPESLTALMDIIEEELALEDKSDADPARIRIIEHEEICKDGSTIWVELRAAFLRDSNGKATDFIGVSRDISEHKAFENELKHAKEDAEAANIAKSEFLANMSHEIRTPMNAIIGMSELIMSTDMTQKQRNFLKIIRSSSKSLLSIINDILDFSKIEAGKLDIENIPITLSNVVEEIPDIFIENIMEKGIEIMLDIDPALPEHIISDPVRLRQILVNLVSNALKFTTEGQIVISVRKQSMTDNTVELLFSVNDTGIGFDTKINNNLFKAFSQADGSTTRKYGGTGLGLTICKRLVNMMGGTIWADSEPGKGSSFYFTINAAVSEDQLEKDLTLHSSLKNKKILVVDDNPSTCEIMKLYLRSFGLRVETADSAYSALDLYKQSTQVDPFDLIIMDIKMPGKDGITACEEILNAEDPNPPAIIIMSASFNDDNMRRIQMANINSFIMKPIRKSSLFDTINEQFGYNPTRIGAFSAEIEQQHDFSDITLLLVEDNPINQIVASEILLAVNARVVKAGTGIEAIEVLKHKSVDAVLMDVQMPEMDGLEATRVIRTGLKMNDLPIIAMTANAMQGDREACIEAGMDDYVAKPIEKSKLFSTLSKWIKLDSTHRDRRTGFQEPDTHATDTPVDIDFPDTLSGINIQAGLKRINGNKRLYLNLLRNFKNDNEDTGSNIRNALKNGKTEHAETLIHAIKGTSGNISAEKLCESAQALENMIAEGSFSNTCIADFETALNIVLESIGRLSDITEDKKSEDEIVSSKKITIEDSRLQPMLKKLSTLLENNDIKAKSYFISIKDYIDPGFKEETDRLKSHISSYKFKQARASLSEITEALKI